MFQGEGVSHRVDKAELLCFGTVQSLAWQSVTIFKSVLVSLRDDAVQCVCLALEDERQRLRQADELGQALGA